MPFQSACGSPLVARCPQDLGGVYVDYELSPRRPGSFRRRVIRLPKLLEDALRVTAVLDLKLADHGEHRDSIKVVSRLQFQEQMPGRRLCQPLSEDGEATDPSSHQALSYQAGVVPHRPH